MQPASLVVSLVLLPACTIVASVLVRPCNSFLKQVNKPLGSLPEAAAALSQPIPEALERGAHALGSTISQGTFTEGRWHLLPSDVFKANSCPFRRERDSC